MPSAVCQYRFRRIVISFLCSFFFFSQVFAQSTGPAVTKWANKPDGTLAEWTHPAVCTDSEGNTYVAGGFSGSLTFATVPSPTTLISEGNADIFIVKYDPSGVALWAKRAGGTAGDLATAVKSDRFGHIYVAGSYSTSASFDGTTLSNPLSTRNNVFLANYDATTGDLRWVKQGATTSCCVEQTATAIAVDNTGNAYLTGGFTNITFDPLPKMYAAGSSEFNGGYPDIYIVKYNGDGIPQWQTRAGTFEPSHFYNFEMGNDIAVDGSGNLYVTGSFNGSSSSPTNFGSFDLVSDGGGGFHEGNFFLAKYNQSAASWEWAVQGGGTANDFGKSVSLDNAGNIYVSGYFESTGNFGSSNLSSIGGSDYFIAKFNGNGVQQWIQPVEGGAFVTHSISKADADGNLYFTGIFQGAVTVGGSALVSGGYDNSYIGKWNSNGDVQWVKHIPGNYYAHLSSLDIGSNGAIYVASLFAGTETFDCTTLTSEGFNNLAVAKLGPPSSAEAPAVQASANAICSGGSTILSIVHSASTDGAEWKWFSGSCGGAAIGTGSSLTVSPTQTTTYYVRSEGGCGGPGACAAITVTVHDGAPTIQAVGGPSAPVAVHSPVSLQVTSPDTDLSSAVINWNDGTPVQSISGISSPFSAAHTYTVPGVYTPTVTITNGCGLGSAAYSLRYVVVYDPNGGFVTGGGWIFSPAGAYKPDPAASGKANFGFESKYQRGATVPSGNTEFRFQTGDMNFRSTSYEWLVVSGSKAQYKGEGTINGHGSYGFMLTAIDGNLQAQASPDKFRIRIWDKANGDAVVYDNQSGADDNAQPTTQIGGGAIMIHNPNNNGPVTRMTSQGDKSFGLQVFGNPSSTRFTVGVNGFSSGEAIVLRVVDVHGRIVEQRSVRSGQRVHIGGALRAGAYLVQALQGNAVASETLIKQ